MLAFVCAVVLFGALQTTTDTALVRAAEASEKRFVPTGWISYCKYPFRIVGAEYMLAHVIPQGDKRRNRYAEVIKVLQNSCGEEPATLQENKER